MFHHDVEIKKYRLPNSSPFLSSRSIHLLKTQLSILSKSKFLHSFNSLKRTLSECCLAERNLIEICQAGRRHSFWLYRDVKIFHFFHFILNYLYTKIPSAKSNITKRKFYQLILYTERKILKINGIADLPWSRVLIGFPLIKCVFSCF